MVKCIIRPLFRLIGQNENSRRHKENIKSGSDVSRLSCELSWNFRITLRQIVQKEIPSLKTLVGQIHWIKNYFKYDDFIISYFLEV
jgi:hypothetical protein